MPRKIDYYTEPISENLEVTPEGYLIARDVVLARTGWQAYKIKELPQDKAAALGIDISNPEAMIDIYRAAADVFDPDTIASFEGKPVVDGHPPEMEFLDPDNFTKFSRGHVQNVRKGPKALPSGDWPLIGDVHITAEPLLSKVKNKHAREISGGYNYALGRENDRILQNALVGNHVAVVPKGRAGPEARINDAALETAPELEVKPSTKETKSVKNWFRFLSGSHLIQMAKAEDADPEKIAEAAIQMAKANDAAESEEKDDEKKAADKKAADAEADKATEAKKAADAAAATAAEEKAKEDAKAADAKAAADKKAADKANDSDDDAAVRGRMHSALDRIMDSRKAKDDKAKKMSDADMEELGGMMADHFTEGDGEGADAVEIEGDGNEEIGEDADLEEVTAADAKDGEEDKDDEDKAGDKANDAKAADAAVIEDRRVTRELLNALRPLVAKANDEQVRGTFNAALRRFKASSASSGGYGKFAQAGRARSNDAIASVKDGGVAQMQQAYKSRHRASGPVEVK